MSSNTIQEDKRLIKLIERTYSNCKDISLEGENYFIPMIKIQNFIFGEKKISLPFLDIGGVFGDITPKRLKEIFNKKIKNGEIRINEYQKNFKKNLDILKKAGFHKKESKAQFYIEIENPEFKWNKFHKHTRNEIRKAKKNNLRIERIENLNELEKFYKLYFYEMKRFGTPCHSYNFFKNMLEIFNEDFFGINCYLNKNLIASGILIFEKEVAYLWFNVSDSQYRINKPNDLIYWTTIIESFKRKIKWIDVGQIDINPENEREKNLKRFKEKWLGKRYKKFIFYYPKKELEKIGNKKEKLKKFRKVWRYLPSPIIKLIGPWVTSHFVI